MIQSKDDKTKISEAEMISALNNSGYLIEQRVEKVFKENKFHTYPNIIYVDIETNKTQEIDLEATKFYKISPEITISIDIICECENNAQPVVFFENKYSNIDAWFELKFLSLPKNFQTILIDIAEDNQSNSLFNNTFSSQYCSFFKPKNKEINSWIAFHPDEQHNTFEKLVKCFLTRKRSTEKSYYDSFTNKRLKLAYKLKTLNGSLTYFLVVLQGHLYKAKLVNGEVELEATNHIKFVKEIPTEHRVETFFIDVIQEKYLPQYIKKNKSESEIILKHIKRNANNLLDSKIMEYLENEQNFEKFKKQYNINDKESE